MTVTELKAHAYDCIIQLEKWQLELRGINNEIKKLDFRFQVKSNSNLTSRLSVESRRIFSITFNAVSILRNL